jgi:hypothetical protein
MPVTKLARSSAVQKRRGAVAASVVVAAVGLLAMSGQASAQIVTNGNFSTEQTGQTGTYSLSGSSTTELPSWSININASEPACLVNAGTSSLCGGGMGTFSDPSNENGIAKNVNGTNGNLTPQLPYLAIMTDTGYTSTISQLVSLTAGSTYTLSFLEAGAEDEGNSGTEIQWTASVGGLALTGIDGSTSPATIISIPSNGTTQWVQENYTFTALTTGTQTLQFLAGSTTSGPPIALLDDVTITKNSVPEPASLAVLGLGIAGLMGIRRRRAAAAAAA